MAHDSFISYAKDDIITARAIRQFLVEEGIRCWMAPDDITPGKEYGAALADAITTSRALILVFSAHANQSRHVPREVEQAVDRGIPIIPFRIADVPPAASLKHFLSGVQWLEASQSPLERHLATLAAAIRELLATKGEVRREPVPVKTEEPPLRFALLYKRHAQPDEEVLRWLEQELSGRGHQVFVDRHMPLGVEWAREVERELAGADAAVVLLSAASVQSEVLPGEVRIAQEAAQKRGGKPRLLPVRLNFEGDMPPELWGALGRLQYFLWREPDDNPRLVGELLHALRMPSAEPLKQSPPTGVLPLNSEVYVERPTDQELLAAIRRRDSVIRIRGARQVGKTSLLARGLHQARSAGTRVVTTDFQKLNASDLESVTTFFRTLGGWVADELGLDIAPEKTWNPQRGPSRNFEQFVCKEIMGRIPGPLVWAMDEADRLFPYPYASEVFGLLRSWHNARATEPTLPWCRLTLAIAYATEAHLFIEDMNQSPFNIGTALTLEDFTPEQVAELNRRYGSPLRTESDLKRYHELVGGHPFLANRGLYEIVERRLDLAAFEAQALRDDGLFDEHLRRILILLAKNPELCEVMRGVLRGRPCPSAESFYRLRSAGVVSGESARGARPRCGLYGLFLERNLP
jgi:hypothetical protein